MISLIERNRLKGARMAECILFVEDEGLGEIRLMAKLAHGATMQVAIERDWQGRALDYQVHWRRQGVRWGVYAKDARWKRRERRRKDARWKRRWMPKTQAPLTEGNEP